MKNRVWPVPALSLAAVLALSSCGSPGDGASPAAGSGSEAAAEAAAPRVMASFYPLQYVTERVGGELVEVESMTPTGAEPHDLELSPAAVEQLRTADAVVYLSGFQPAVDDAVAQAAPERVLDATEAGVEGMEEHTAEEHAQEESTVEPGDEEEHAEHEEETPADDGHGHEQGAADPHFWLDPQRLAAVATEVAHELGEADPENAQVHEDNAEQLTEELTALDEEFTQGLATCETRTIVVSHEAYGYLAEKYDLEQVGIAGLEPDTEPSPARLAEIGEVVRAEDVDTIFSESLVNPKVAETLAADLGVDTAVLDPVEGLAEGNTDYQQVMRDNLDALRGALRCQ